MLIAATSSAQPPTTPGTDMRCLSLPSLPTMRAIRAVSRARRSLNAAMSLNASAILPLTPVRSDGSRTPKSPFRRERSAASSSPENGSVRRRCAPVGNFEGLILVGPLIFMAPQNQSEGDTCIDSQQSKGPVTGITSQVGVHLFAKPTIEQSKRQPAGAKEPTRRATFERRLMEREASADRRPE